MTDINNKTPMEKLNTLILILLGMICTQLYAVQLNSIYTLKPNDSEAFYFTPENYPIKADGKMDVSDALQAAINQVKKEKNFGILFIPEGKYKISKTIYIPTAIRLIGYGKNRPEFILAKNSPGFQEEVNELNKKSNEDEKITTIYSYDERGNRISKEQIGGIQMGFKEGFFWGGATAANQYEGGYLSGGKGLAIQDVITGGDGSRRQGSEIAYPLQRHCLVSCRLVCPFIEYTLHARTPAHSPARTCVCIYIVCLPSPFVFL